MVMNLIRMTPLYIPTDPSSSLIRIALTDSGTMVAEFKPDDTTRIDDYGFGVLLEGSFLEGYMKKMKKHSTCKVPYEFTGSIHDMIVTRDSGKIIIVNELFNFPKVSTNPKSDLLDDLTPEVWKECKDKAGVI